MTSIVNNTDITFREPTEQERATLLYQRGRGFGQAGIVAGGSQTANIDDIKFVFIDNGTGWIQRVTVDKNASEEEVRDAIANNQLGSQENATKWNIVDSFGYQGYFVPRDEPEFKQPQYNPPFDPRGPLHEGDLPDPPKGDDPPVLPDPPVLIVPDPPIPPQPQPPLVIPPVRVTSLANPPTGMAPLVPKVELIRGNPDPAGTFRATSVEEMFTVGTSLPTADVVYEVGLPFDPSKSFIDGLLVVRNNTTNQDLLVEVELPVYLRTDSSTTFVVGADLKAGLRVFADLAVVQREAVSLTQLFRADKISITVRPQNVTGPVFVRRDLPQLMA